ncbi:MAG: MFS transporter [Deltaproteobacteria bacterium]|nr:MFS transporter [Deltaproteobacteria bacterium]
MTRYRKFTLLASLYFSQGLPYGFFASALPTLLREQGVSLANIGLANLLALPWALKFLWAPVVDRHGSTRHGWRRSWILPLQLVAILNLMVLGSLGPTAAVGLILVCVLMNLVAATQDIATDGLAVELLNSEERGLGNGIQVGGYRVGMIVGGGLLLVIVGRVGWTLSFLAMAGVLAVASLPILFYKEPAIERGDRAQPAASSLLGSLSRPGIWLWLVLLVIYKSGDAIASGMINPFLVDSGLSVQQVGWLSTLGSIASFVGAFVGGWGITRLGRRRGLLFFGLLQAVAVAGYVIAAFTSETGGLTSYGFLTALSIAEHFTGTMATVALFTMMMDVCRPGLGATDYTLQASVVVIAQLGARSLSGFSADQLSHLGNFTLSAGLSLVGAILAGLLLQNASFRDRLLGPTESSW